MCEHCRNIQTWRKFDAPKDYLACICLLYKSAMHTRFANGAHYGAYAPLGYVKDPYKKGHLLIDPETRWIVEKIFDLAVHGRGAASICLLYTSRCV